MPRQPLTTWLLILQLPVVLLVVAHLLAR